MCVNHTNRLAGRTARRHLQARISRKKSKQFLRLPVSSQAEMLHLLPVIAAVFFAQAYADYTYPAVWSAATLVNSTVSSPHTQGLSAEQCLY